MGPGSGEIHRTLSGEICGDDRFLVVEGAFEEVLFLEFGRADKPSVYRGPMPSVGQFPAFPITGIQIHGCKVAIEGSIRADNVYANIAKPAPAVGFFPARPFG